MGLKKKVTNAVEWDCAQKMDGQMKEKPNARDRDNILNGCQQNANSDAEKKTRTHRNRADK